MEACTEECGWGKEEEESERELGLGAHPVLRKAAMSCVLCLWRRPVEFRPFEVPVAFVCSLQLCVVSVAFACA